MNSNLKPIIYKALVEVPTGSKIVEAYNSAIAELCSIETPHLKSLAPEERQALIKEFTEKYNSGEVWIYYPEKHIAVHTLPEGLYFKLRTARNRNIITQTEQENYRGVTVGVMGLSVGSAVVNSLVISGGPKKIKIADFDTVEITNLNRIRASLLDIGTNKTLIAGRSVWELDPFAELELWDNGVSKESLPDFLHGNMPLDVVVDEMDSIDLKIRCRLLAKTLKLPVLMATDNGDGVILDVERFDLEPEREIFHGLIGHMEPNDLEGLDFKAWLQLATRIVGAEFLTESMQESILMIGKEIAGVPQVGTTASLAGTAMAFAIRQIANKKDLPSGRYLIGLEEKLIPDYNSSESVEKRNKKTQEFIGSFKNKN